MEETRAILESIGQQKEFWFIGHPIKGTEVNFCVIYESDFFIGQDFILPNGKKIIKNDNEYILLCIKEGIIEGVFESELSPKISGKDNPTSQASSANQSKVFIVHGTENQPVKELKHSKRGWHRTHNSS